MSEYEYRWTPEAKARVILRGFNLTEVAQALYSSRRISNRVGDMLIVIGQTDAGRVLTVVTFRISGTLLFAINRVVETTGDDLAIWNEETS